MTWIEPGLNLPEIPEGWREWNEVDELRYELRQAISTVEFLHGCLTDPTFEYAYPEMTLERFGKWKSLIEGSPECTARESSRHPSGVCPVHHRLMPK